MPTPKSFQQCPPFPSDIPIAGIPIISYANLKNNSGYYQDSQNLFTACREQGFFLLDLRGNEEDGGKLLKIAEQMFDISTAVFSLGHEELLKYRANIPDDLNGYKPPGLIKTDDGKLDAVAVYTLSRDDVLGKSSRRDPEVFERRREQCQEFFRNAHKVITVILSHLNKHLGLDFGTLASLSPLDKPSATALRMLLTRPQEEDKRITFGGHTDIGTITMLFHIVGGLQILPAESENIASNWRYIRPEPRCALINIRDSLVEWTGEVLRSSLHRVIAPPGEQADVIRQSLAYLVRPAHNGSMKRLNSQVIPPLTDGEEEETRSVEEWVTWRTQEILNGKLKAQTRGGRSIRTNLATEAVKMAT